jgi:GTPase SAR1 family protein
MAATPPFSDDEAEDTQMRFHVFGVKVIATVGIGHDNQEMMRVIFEQDWWNHLNPMDNSFAFVDGRLSLTLDGEFIVNTRDTILFVDQRERRRTLTNLASWIVEMNDRFGYPTMLVPFNA